MNYSTTYYFGNRAAGQQFARWVTPVAGGATLTETEGYWSNFGVMHTDEGAAVVVVHDGGMVGSKIDALAKQCAADFGEEKVLRVTVDVYEGSQLTAYNYSYGDLDGTPRTEDQ